MTAPAAKKRIEPGPAFCVVPSSETSTSPSLMISTSSWRCRTASPLALPTASVVTCTCSRSTVSVGPSRTWRRTPFGIGTAWSEAQSNTFDASGAPEAAGGAASGGVAAGGRTAKIASGLPVAP